uniref:Colicin D immunity protein domain-containing protein n=1 Tax=Streptomyces sp. NBC_00049 TaxID=2903617 RepID=A0AAU2JZD8_9ACTN
MRERFIMAPDPLDQMAEAWTVFDEGLRMQNGFDEEIYASFKQSLHACADAWATLDAIPRLGVNILVDVFAATEANADLYEGESADRVMEAAYELHNLIGECVALL